MAKGSLQTQFKNAAFSTVNAGGDGVTHHGSYPVRGGQPATPGKIDQVITVQAGTVGDVDKVKVTGVANRS